MNKKNVKTLKALKSKLKKTLPARICSVMQSYDQFSGQTIPEDAKGFTAHHNACKSAVIHAETLLKLARWTDEDFSSSVTPSAAIPKEFSLGELLAEASEAGKQEDVAEEDADEEITAGLD